MANPFDDLVPQPAAANDNPFADLVPLDGEILPPQPAAGARAAAEDAGGTRQTSQPLGRMEYLSGLAQKAAQGLTANFGDEVAATLGAVGGKLPGGHGKGRQELLREIRGAERTFEDQNPKTAMGAEVAGAVAGGVNAGAALARGLPWLARGVQGVTRAAVGSGAAAIPGGAADRVGRLEGEHSAGDVAIEAGKGAAIAGGLGAVTGGAGRAAANVVGPWISPVARRLHELGVRLTPGEMIGGYAKRAEDAMGSVPFAGAMIRNRQAEGVESLNRATYREALEPVTRTARRSRVADDTEVGHDSVQEMTDILGRRYDHIVPRMSANFDTLLETQIRAISGNLPQSVRPQYADAIRRHIASVIDRTQPHGPISGRGLQRSFQGLRGEARRLQTGQNSNAYDYDLGEALQQTHDALMGAASRYTPPRIMTSFRNLNEAYARFALVRDASSRVSSEGGVFSPAALHSAVRSGDRSAGKGAMARGTARMENVSGPAKAVMGHKIGDSGTPERAALVTAILAPSIALKSAVPVAALAALYTRPGNRAFQALGTTGMHTRDALKRAMISANLPAAAGIGRGGANLLNGE